MFHPVSHNIYCLPPQQTDTQGYPLVSKAPVFRKLRKSLSEFFDRLVRAASEADTLFSSDVIPTLQSWVVAMSSAQLRSFRHTATIVALEVESALCTVAADIEKAAETIHRQKEAERKKRKGAGVSEREKTLSSKAAEAKGRKTKMNELLNDFFDG
jgi:cohesin complex subunit SA-1/2